jgi:hypothetical protein
VLTGVTSHTEVPPATHPHPTQTMLISRFYLSTAGLMVSLISPMAAVAQSSGKALPAKITLIQPDDSLVFEASDGDQKWPAFTSESDSVTAVTSKTACIKSADERISTTAWSSGTSYVRDKRWFDTKDLIPRVMGIDRFCALYRIAIVNDSRFVLRVKR